MMFADDVILLGEASKDQAQIIKNCLQKFCDASGQKVSKDKSRIYFSPNTNDAVIAEVCNTLEIPQTDDLGRYLGVPTINGRVTKTTFGAVIDRVENRLAGWRAKCLSLAGRVTLVTSTINAIPAYVMQSARLPRSVCDTLDNRIRRFLWGGTSIERKPHLVKWDTLIKEKSKGGLRLRSMRHLNTAFLMKLGWRLKSEPSALWVRLLNEKYCRGRDINSITGRGVNCSNAWRGILETRELLDQGLGVAIGDGRHTEFWNQKWLDGKVLAQQALQRIPPEQRLNRACDYWKQGMG